MEKNQKRDDGAPSAVFKVGAISLAFLIVGYQAAIFIGKAARDRIVASRDAPDTVYVVDEALAARLLRGGGSGFAGPGVARDGGGGAGIAGGAGAAGDGWAKADGGWNGGGAGDGAGGGRSTRAAGGATGDAVAEFAPSLNRGENRDGGRVSKGKVIVRRNASHSQEARSIYAGAPVAKPGEGRQVAVRKGRRTVESFRFNHNTVSLDDLIRLGFSEKQAQSIVNYRDKGGRFRRKSDFAKSYVVADSVYKRLEPYIVIPKLDINKADSSAFDELPGIGGYFARKMVEYRQMLGGYSCKEQLMEIYHFDRDKYDALADLITCSPAPPFPLWSAQADTLRRHPHIRSWQTARAIVLYREHNPREAWTVDGLRAAGILTPDQAERLARCRVE